jgi:hypothetical protein
MLAYQFNGDYTSDNIFCAVSEEGEVLASAHIAPDQSWNSILDPNKSLEFEFKLQMDLSKNENATVPQEAVDELTDAVINRAKMIRNQYYKPLRNVNVNRRTEKSSRKYSLSLPLYLYEYGKYLLK